MMTMRTKLFWWIGRIRTRFALWLLKKGAVVSVEARHGAFRARSRQFWIGQCLRVDIPLQRANGVTDTPFGRVSTVEAKKLIDAFTGVEGEDGFQELRPGRGKLEHHRDNGRIVCVLCGHDLSKLE
jgi:hypothetical protein